MAEERRVAVVTGGASGIGLDIVRHLASRGCAVVAADVDDAACDAARGVLAQHGDAIRVVAADVGTAQGARSAVDTAAEAFGRVDVLCNNAAVHPMKRIEEHDLASWQKTFRVNVDGPMLCSQAALHHMKAQGAGTIVNIGSISGIAPYAGGGAYAASKAALAMLTRVLAIEAGPYGVTVNCICPGAIRHGTRADDASPPANIPVGRAGTPADVAHLVSYLASDAARYVTGSVIVLDGGATAGRVRPAGGRQH